MSYRRSYRRPYYNNRSRDDRGEPNWKAAVVLIFGLFITFSILTNPGAVIQTVLGFALLIGIVVLIVMGIKRLFKWHGRPSGSNTASAEQQDITQINSKKHGCKCYMDGLTYGEQEIANILAGELSYKDYFIFNNLIIPSENNGSTQIDHIVVSRFGIFVIESKDYKGWIFGDKDEKFWTQSLPGGKNKFQFQNPIHQNFAHIMALKALMPFASNCFHGIVVFSSSSEIKSVPIENVVHVKHLIGCIKKYTQEQLSESNVQLAIGKLSYACQTVDIAPSEHVANLRASH